MAPRAVPDVAVAVDVAADAGTVREGAGTDFLKPPPMRPPLRPLDIVCVSVCECKRVCQGDVCTDNNVTDEVC